MTSLKRPMPGTTLFSATARLLMDMAFPPRCPSCHGDVAAEGNFCKPCFDRLHMIAAPLCACCGIPFMVAVEGSMHCPECLESPPHFAMARAAMVYDAVSAPLISALKFNDQWAGLARHAQMMVGSGSHVLHGADYLVPVPLHWRRLMRRRYNQSALLAYAISRRTGVACAPHMLHRVRHTPPQMRLDRATRLKNVRRAFAVSAQAEVQDKILVLVDDVVTTGATVNACAAVLKNAGAKEVRVLALARTVKE